MTSQLPKRVLLFSHNSNLSGAPLSLVLLARQLPSLGYTPLFVLPKKGPIEKVLAEWKLEYTVLKKPNGMFGLCRIIRQEKPALVHVNSLVKTWPVIAARLIGKPVIWHVREYLGKKRMYARLIHLLATRVILISEEQFVLFQGLSKAVIIPNGIDLSLFEKVRPAVLPHDRNEDVRTVVTYVGTIEPRKGLFVLARAACLLGDLPWIHFVIVGEASRGNEAYKQKVVELVNSHGLEKRFHFLGQRKDIPEILAASDALCHPAFKEVFPRVILEAMASKIPVIAAGVGGITEMVRDGKEGFVVQSGDHSGFADAIRLIDSKKSLKVQMGKSCYGRVKREFTIQKHALKVAGLYKDILEESRAQGVQ